MQGTALSLPGGAVRPTQSPFVLTMLARPSEREPRTMSSVLMSSVAPSRRAVSFPVSVSSSGRRLRSADDGKDGRRSEQYQHEESMMVAIK